MLRIVEQQLHGSIQDGDLVRSCFLRGRANTTHNQEQRRLTFHNLPPNKVRRNPTQLFELRHSRAHMLIPAKRCCFAPESQIACERLRTMPNSIFGTVAAAACSGGQSRTECSSSRAKADCLFSGRYQR